MNSAVRDKIYKDFKLYKGLVIPVVVVNVGDYIALANPVEVEVLGFDSFEQNDIYIDTYWKVRLTESAEQTLRAIAPESDCIREAYIPGFSYEVGQDDEVIDCYRGWL